MNQDFKSPNFNWFERNIVKHLFKIIDYILGRDESYYLRMSQRGKILMGQSIRNYAQMKLGTEITQIYLVGMMDMSKEQFRVQKANVIQGKYQIYFQSGNYAVTDGVIMFFQVKTVMEKYYVLGWEDSYDYNLPEVALFLESISEPIDITSLSKVEYLYYPAA